MHWIRRQYRPDHKQTAMPFSPVFDDAVLPQAFVSSLGHSCQARCYPHSPPKNLRPRAAAHQTLNRSIRHTVLGAAGVWAVALGACLVPWPETCALSHTHTHSQLHNTHAKGILFYKTTDLFFCVKCPIVLFLTSVLSVGHWPLSLLLIFPRPATDLHCENTHKAYLPICSVADFDYAPLASHLSRVYPNMKINSQLNAAICSPRGSGEQKSNTGLH